MGTTRFTGGPRFTGTLQFPAADGDGIVHLYVATTGNDNAFGNISRPMATVQEAATRVARWTLLGKDQEIVVHIAAGVYAENVQLSLPVAPRRRVIFTGDRTAMTLLHTGQLTAGAANVFTDTGATFGTADELLGYIVTVWNPADQPGTQQWFTIGDHDGTQIYPPLPASPVPAAGWEYRVYKPSVRITGVTSADGRHATVEVVQPGGSTNKGMYVGFGPAVLLEFMSIERAHGTTYSQAALRTSGGHVAGVGLVIESTDTGLEARYTRLACGGLNTTGIADPAHGLAASDTKLSGASIGLRCVGGSYALYLNNVEGTGAPVIRSTSGGVYGMYVGIFSRLNFVGGTIHGGSYNIITTDGADVTLRRGGTGAPFRLKGASGHSIRADGRSKVTIYEVAFDTIGGSAMSGRMNSLFYLSDAAGTPTVNAVTQYGIALDEQSIAILSPTTPALAGGVGELLVDAATGTFAGVVTGTPLNGAGGSRVSRFPG